MIEKYGSLIYGTEEEIMQAIREKERQEPSVTPSRGWEEMTVPCENCGHDMTFKIAVCGELDRRKGKWIETEYHRWRCSVCREKGMSEWDNIHDVRTNFCPDCGAKMESEK